MTDIYARKKVYRKKNVDRAIYHFDMAPRLNGVTDTEPERRN